MCLPRLFVGATTPLRSLLLRFASIGLIRCFSYSDNVNLVPVVFGTTSSQCIFYCVQCVTKQNLRSVVGL